MKYIPTICPYCGVGCGLKLKVEDESVIGLEYWENNPVNEGSLCPKGNTLQELVYHKDRLRYPLIKENGTFKKVSWDIAFTTFAKKFLEVRDKYGPDAIAIFASAKCTNEENYLLQKFARAVIGTNNIDHCARLCHAPTVVGLNKAFGSGAMTNTFKDFIDSNCIFIIGANPFEQHPVAAKRILDARDKGAKIIVADPRFTHTAWHAGLYLQHKPGTDVALLNAMINVILKEGLEDKKFIQAQTKGFEELKKSIAKTTPEWAEEITGVPAQKIREAAITYAKANRASIVYSMGITQHTTGSDNVQSIANLAMLTGNIGRPGTGVNPLRGQDNVQGACDMGCLPGVYSGYQSVANPDMRKKIEEGWGISKLPDKPGLTVTEVTSAILEGKIKALYIMGENVVITDPDSLRVEEALKKLEFLAVSDIFPTETSEFANLIFPAASWAEKEGTVTNTERRVQLRRMAIEPLGESKPDWMIICELAKRLGAKTGFNFSSPEEIFNEMRNLTPQYSGITYERLSRLSGINWPCPSEDHDGTPILYTSKFATSDGKGVFNKTEFKPPVERPNKEYPFILTTGRVIHHYNSGSMTRRTKELVKEVPESYVEISETDALKLGIKDGDHVLVKSRRGEIKVKAKITIQVPPGIVFIPFHFAEGRANILTHHSLDPVAKIPEFKALAVSIHKA
ncbi:MAG: formate dehydrogenase subunit alpha [Candidatus Bathyarchaeota archaeon]